MPSSLSSASALPLPLSPLSTLPHFFPRCISPSNHSSFSDLPTNACHAAEEVAKKKKKKKKDKRKSQEAAELNVSEQDTSQVQQVHDLCTHKPV